jgi:hypothetical protein
VLAKHVSVILVKGQIVGVENAFDEEEFDQFDEIFRYLNDQARNIIKLLYLR